MINKRYFSSIELIKIATQHACCADSLLYRMQETSESIQNNHDSLLSVTSLMTIAFELTLKAYLSHVHRPVKQQKKLLELLALNEDFVFSSHDLLLLKRLNQQQGFRKGIDYELWDNSQQFHVFCIKIIEVYERLQQMMPLELQPDYIA
jgi:hypothetical protein